MESKSIPGRLLQKYVSDLYPQVNHRRGATRVRRILENIALPKVDPGMPVVDLEWDNLIILDACRYDLYNSVVQGEIDYRYSAGSHSKEYIEKNFSEGDYSDTVYVSANPYMNETESSDLTGFQDLTGRSLDDAFSCVFNTDTAESEEDLTMPEELVKDAKTAQRLFSGKKKIVHFMKPHAPFLNYDFDTPAGLNEWQAVEREILDRERVLKAYRDNLKAVLPYVNDLINSLPGKTAVTADHGHMIGENGVYGHFYGCRYRGLHQVPWHVVEDDQRIRGDFEE